MRTFQVISLLSSLLPNPASAHSWTPKDACPTEIKVTIPNSEYCDGPDDTQVPCKNAARPYFGSMVSVHDALSHCPNITSLDLKVALSGCTGIPDRWSFPLSYDGGDTYPNLKKIRLQGYDFGSIERAPWQMPLPGRVLSEAWTFGLFDWLKRGHWKPWLQAQLDKYRGLQPSAPPKTNLDLWLDAMDWSGVEELAVDRFTEEFIDRVPHLLASLRSLELKNTHFVEALPNNTLTKLKWIGQSRHGDLANILGRQGATLKELEFRCDEIKCPSFRNTFSVSIIPEMAANLRHLTINLERNGTWPIESLQNIASLPNLSSLVIYFNLQSDCQREFPKGSNKSYCTGQDHFQKPLLDASEAEYLFQLVKKANVGGQLQNVTFRLGDWTPPWTGPLYFPPWIEDRQVEIVCSNGDPSKDTVQGEKSCELVRSFGYWPSEPWDKNLWHLPQIELGPTEDY